MSNGCGAEPVGGSAMGGVVVPSCNALIGTYNVCFTEEVVSDKEELGVDDIEEDEERRGWRSISCRKLCTRRRLQGN